MFDTRGKRNFTEPHLTPGKSPWTGVDSNTEANVFSTAVELPTSELGGKTVRIWGRCSVRRDGKLLHVDRAGHPSVSSFFNTDDTKEEYNASEPVNDRDRWLELFIHLMGHTGNYTREEAIAAIDAHGILPDMLSFDPRQPAQYPNGRVFADDVINHRLAFLTKGECPPDGSEPAYRHPRGLSLSRHAAPEEELERSAMTHSLARERSSSLMIMSELEARGPEEHEKVRGAGWCGRGRRAVWRARPSPLSGRTGRNDRPDRRSSWAASTVPAVR